MPSTICPYKNTAPSPSASRDCICNHGNKIQVQQHKPPFLWGWRAQRGGQKEGGTIKCSCAAWGLHWDPLSSLSPAWGEVRNMGIYFTMEDDPLESNQNSSICSSMPKPLLYPVLFYLKKWSISGVKWLKPLVDLPKARMSLCAKMCLSLVFQLEWDTFSLSLIFLSFCSLTFLFLLSLWLSLFFSLSLFTFHTARQKGKGRKKKMLRNSHSFDQQTWH